MNNNVIDFDKAAKKEAVSRDVEDFLLKARLAKIALLQRGENK